MIHLNVQTISRIISASIVSLLWPAYASAKTPLPTQTIDENKCIVTETGVQVCPKTWATVRTKHVGSSKKPGRCLVRFTVKPNGEVKSTKILYSRFRSNNPSATMCRKSILRWTFEPLSSETNQDVVVQLYFKKAHTGNPSYQNYRIHVSFTDFDTTYKYEPQAQYYLKYSAPFVSKGF